jgi:peptidoglycan hydrolase-like protein with peptidoglycan-binding domain
MAHPELRRDSTETDEVRRLQQLLETALQGQGIQLSRVDGIFGPITEASVIYLQGQSGLPQTGVVDDATWAVLEALRRHRLRCPVRRGRRRPARRQRCG